MKVTFVLQLSRYMKIRWCFYEFMTYQSTWKSGDAKFRSWWEMTRFCNTNKLYCKFMNSWLVKVYENQLMLSWILYCNYQGTWKSGDAKNSLGILNIQSQWIVYIVKVSWLFTLLKSADILHSKSQLITESYLNMEGIDFLVKILVFVKILG